MSGFYYVLQRLGTVSLIKQIILEGKATGKRRRKTGGKCVFATHSGAGGGAGEKKNSRTAPHPTHCACACAHVDPCVRAHAPNPATAGADLITSSRFPHFIKAHKALVCSEETQIQMIVMRWVDADSQPPSDL